MSAPVCRYYLNGSCRFGDRCRFSHDVSESSYDSNYSPQNNPYVLNRNQPTDRHNYNEPKQNWRQNISYNDIQEIVEKIRDEAKQVEYEKLWPMTCLNVLKEASNVPGWDDYSMEELRVAAYSAKLTGRFDEYVRLYGTFLQKAKESRSIFLRPGKRAEEVVRSMFEKRNQHGGNPSSNFSFAQVPAFSGFNSSATASGLSGAGSVFGGPPAPTSGSAFGSTPFGAGTSDPAPGIFAMAAQGFSSNASQGSVLNDTDMETASESLLNQSSTSGGSPFHQNIFGQVVQQSGSSALPTTTASVFGPSVFGGSTARTVDGNTAGKAASSSVFGGAPAPSSVFGGASSTSVFGGAPATSNSSVFGGPAGSPFASSQGNEYSCWEEKRHHRRKKAKNRRRSSSRSQSRSRSRSKSRFRSQRRSRSRNKSRSWSKDRHRSHKSSKSTHSRWNRK